ncbi:hypothetical protein HED50_24000 [Ochrobactrum oryzae]|uniref:Uncharacterized protein n=1 Tax=Brucella tritici TaxID=94626 RepID=A0A7X6JD68_9HYPH|nr:hypothetical protein [Brucella oryzae]NKW11412.1 hypothetical protein [Brucella tritici]
MEPETGFRHQGLFNAASHAAEDAADNVQNTIDELRPKGRLKARSFGDRYADGGIQRFKELSDGLDAKEIDAALAAWDRIPASTW